LGDRAGALPSDSAGAIAADAAPAETEPPRNQRNYNITDADKVGLGSLKQKCRANLAAIELLKTRFPLLKSGFFPSLID
jgi:hypothetical protein